MEIRQIEASRFAALLRDSEDEVSQLARALVDSEDRVRELQDLFLICEDELIASRDLKARQSDQIGVLTQRGQATLEKLVLS